MSTHNYNTVCMRGVYEFVTLLACKSFTCNAALMSGNFYSGQSLDFNISLITDVQSMPVYMLHKFCRKKEVHLDLGKK